MEEKNLTHDKHKARAVVIQSVKDLDNESGSLHEVHRESMKYVPNGLNIFCIAVVVKSLDSFFNIHTEEGMTTETVVDLKNREVADTLLYLFNNDEAKSPSSRNE